MQATPAPHPRPRLLGLDTSTERMAVAVTDGVQTHTLDDAGGALASKRLLGAVQELLQKAQWPLGSLDAIAFAKGPGAFTGLRTAASVTQGLALGLGCAVLAVDSLMIVAEAARLIDQDNEPIWVAMDARMGEIYACAYRWQGGALQAGAWQPLGEPQLLSVEGFCSALASHPLPRVVGSALAVFADRLVLPVGTVACPMPEGRAHALASLALAAWVQGKRLDAAQAVPVYVRDQVAFTTAEREQRARNALAALPSTQA